MLPGDREYGFIAHAVLETQKLQWKGCKSFNRWCQEAVGHEVIIKTFHVKFYETKKALWT